MMMIIAQLTAAAQGLASHLLWILPTFIGKIPEPDSRRDSPAALPGLSQLSGDLEPADDRSQGHCPCCDQLLTSSHVQADHAEGQPGHRASGEELEPADVAAGSLRKHRNQHSECKTGYNNMMV